MSKRKPLTPPPPRDGAEAQRELARVIAGLALPPAKPPAVPMVTTAIHVPRRTLALLRIVAATRANRDGGRASVSAVLVALVEAQREALERENK